MTKCEVVKQYLRKYKNTPTRTLARMIYRDNKELFKDTEAVRTVIRYYRNASGKRKKYFKEFEREKFVFPKLPKGLTSINNWDIVKITGNHKVLIISDLHIPFHNEKAIKIAINTAQKEKVDIIILNGDIIDFYALSEWIKNPKLRDLKRELDYTRQFLAWLRELFPKVRIIWKLGNHEERYDNYLWIKAPELFGIPEYSFSTFFHLDEYNIELVTEKKPIKLNELIILHGHEFKHSINNPVNPARGIYLKTKVNTLIGHYHQSSAHTEKNVEDKVTTCWSIGCLCELHPAYMPLNKWSHGFAIVKTSGQKLFNVYAYKILKGKIYSE